MTAVACIDRCPRYGVSSAQESIDDELKTGISKVCANIDGRLQALQLIATLSEESRKDEVQEPRET